MTTKTKAKRGPQARGLARRQQLEDAAETLLQKNDIDQISLADVAGEAGIPVASAYSFYGNINDLFARLLVKHTVQMFDVVEASIAPETLTSWMDAVERVIDGVAQYLRGSRPLQQLRLSGKTLPEIRYAEDRPTGGDYAERVRALIDARFVLPEMEGGNRPIMIMLDLAEAVVVSEYIRSQGMPKGIGREAKRAAIAYLKLYIPEYLPVRSQPEIGDNNGETQ